MYEGGPRLTDSSARPISLQRTPGRIRLSLGRLEGVSITDSGIDTRFSGPQSAVRSASFPIQPYGERLHISHTRSNKATLILDLDLYNNPASLELDPAVERKGIYYALQTRNLILSGKRGSLTLSWLTSILWWWGILIVCQCRGLKAKHIICAQFILESLLNVYLIFHFNHCYVFDQKALRIRVRNVVLSRRDSTGIIGRNNWES